MFGCSSKQVLSPSDYTKEYAATLLLKNPNLKVTIKGEMELAVFDENGKEVTAFLDNGYKEYVATPKDKELIIGKYIAAFIEPRAQSAEIDTSRITPVIKDREWIAEIRAGMKERGAKDIPENVYEDLNHELVIVYAEDSPKNLRYLTPKDLESVNLKPSELRSLAVKNLKSIVPKIEVQGGNGIYMVTAGGDYEASLILFEALWDGIQIKVDGDYVIAIPSRDMLLITGSNNKEGIRRIRDLAIKTVAEAPYRLTSDLFVRKNGDFVKYEE
ncbi:hypothetical protein BH11VER1_BH11VER1_20500 [soil metagenome]